MLYKSTFYESLRAGQSNLLQLAQPLVVWLVFSLAWLVVSLYKPIIAVMLLRGISIKDVDSDRPIL